MNVEGCEVESLRGKGMLLPTGDEAAGFEENVTQGAGEGEFRHFRQKYAG
jgi:hypothetical protein